MRKKVLQLIVVLVAFCQMQVLAQTGKVTGKVIGPDNNPVAGASVTISGTNQGTVTDADGNYSLSVPEGSSLLINSIGFKEQVVKVDGRSVVNVSLAAGQGSGLEEVVVTGYTAQKKKDIVGSVAVVDVKALKAVPSHSAMGALQGQAAGVNVINNGSPGAQSNILIRGVTSFGSNAPLVLIDGIQGNINDVPAVDVESIQVLKDAGAASIYGARGANGVIIITTKKGKSGATSVVYDSYYNMQVPKSIDKLNLLSVQDYANIYSDLAPLSQLFPGGQVRDFLYRGPSGRGTANAGDPAVDPSLYNLDILNPGQSYIIAPIDKNNSSSFYDAITDPALMMQQNITASGGTDRASYLLSLGYLDHRGVVKNTKLQRYNVRINTQFKIGNHVRIGENLNLQYRNNPSFAVNGGFGPVQSAILSPTYLPLYDIAGNYSGTFAGPNDEVGDWGSPLATVETIFNNRRRAYGINGNVFVEVDFLKNFTLRSTAGGSIDNYYNQTYTPRQYWARNGAVSDRLDEAAGVNTTGQWTNTLTYKNQFGLHNLTVLAGTEAVERKSRAMVGRADNFLFDNYEFLVLNKGATKFPGANTFDDNSLGGAVGEDALFSVFGRLDYSYNEKYLLTFTLRRDGYSAFGPNTKYGNFPALAVGWRVSQESFMKNVTWVNDLKLRASYGEMGNKEAVPRYNAYSLYDVSQQFSYYPIDGSNNTSVRGFYPRAYGNANTSWETNKLLNVGFDATLFNNKLDLSVEYYKKSIDGLLRQLQFPWTAGEGTSPFVNVGDIQNKGVDINANYRARLSNDLNLTVGANFTTYKSKVTDLPDPGYVDYGNIRVIEGQPMSTFYGYKRLGVFKDQKDVDDHAVQPEAQPGRWKYQDTDGNDTINQLDRVVIGDPNPDFTLGLNLGLTWKNFDFTAVLYGSFGQDIWNGLQENLSSWEINGVGNAKSDRVLDAWTPDNPNGTWKKAELSRNFSNSSERNDQFIEKGSFFRLRTVQIGYNFQTAGLRNLGINRMRAFVGGSNLFVITKYSGLDPEVNEGGPDFRGTDAGAYVQPAGVMLGLNVTF